MRFSSIILCLLIISCGEKRDTRIFITTTNPEGISDLGRTLIHEHVLVDFIGADSTGYHRWNRDSVVKRVLPYLMDVKEHGVNTLLECTPAYLGRDPSLLKALADKSGLNILTNTGFYGAVQDKYLPNHVFSMNSDSIAQIWINEFNTGIDGTGIRPGFIKISVDPDSTLSMVDEKLVLAAIKAHLETGLTIVSHTGPNAPALAQLKLLDESPIHPSAWVWTHAQNGTSDTQIAAAQKGAWISLDNVHQDRIDQTINQLDELKKAGFLHKVLISHDAGWYRPGKANGGKFRAYSDIFTHLIPELIREGWTQNEIDQLLIRNPNEAYRIEIRLK